MGNTERITRPQASLELPAGQYRLQSARLKGGYTYSRRVSGYDWVTVAADKPATLKVGAPLVPALKVQREGRILWLGYELLGVGGETYTGGDRSKPPTFAVYKGQKKIASGKFELGWGGTRWYYAWRAPPTVFGKLQVVPSADLGELGAQQGEAASYDWKWYYSASGFVIWLALILALVVPKANRNIRVLLILIPLAIVKLPWWLFMQFTGMVSSYTLLFTLILNSLAVGVTVLWLMANYFVRFGGAIRFLPSFVTVVIVAGLGTLFYRTEFSSGIAGALLAGVLMLLPLFVAMPLSQTLCGRKYRPVCFMLWLALWTPLCTSVGGLGLMIAISLTTTEFSLVECLKLPLIMGGLVFGLCLYAFNLPFMILGFAHPFFRERFCACLGLQSAPSGLASQTGENTEAASFCEEN